MSRRGNIILGATIVGLGGGFLIYRSVKRNKLFDEISAAIGGPGNAISKYTEFFSPNYYKQFKEGEAIFQSTGNVLQWANEFNSSFGYFNDDEDKAYGVLRAIPDGVALSQVSEKYNNKFGEDFLFFLILATFSMLNICPLGMTSHLNLRQDQLMKYLALQAVQNPL